MKNLNIKLLPVFFPILALLAGCGSSAPTDLPAIIVQNQTWTIQVEQVDVKSELKTTEMVTLYTGDKNEVVHENTPASGNDYLILKLKVSKTGSASLAFDWSTITIEDEAGTNYTRLANDSFIEQHNYTPRMTSLPIRFGENEGWVCYEIPTTSVNNSLWLVAAGTEGQEKIKLNLP